jgi:hypothetical protein
MDGEGMAVIPAESSSLAKAGALDQTHRLVMLVRCRQVDRFCVSQMTDARTTIRHHNGSWLFMTRADRRWKRRPEMFVIDDVAVAVGVHYLVAHGSAALAAKGAALAEHPVSTAATMAVHHGVASLISNATFPAATNTVSAAINVVHVPIQNQAVLSHGAAATGSAVTALHDAVKFALPVAAGVAWQRVRKSERYRAVKDDLSVLLDKAMTAL